jgi:hypothetical protein
MCFCLLRISDRKDSPIRSSSQKKPYSRRQRVQQHIRPQQECVLLQFLFEEQAKYRQEIEEQQVESNQLNKTVVIKKIPVIYNVLFFRSLFI